MDLPREIEAALHEAFQQPYSARSCTCKVDGNNPGRCAYCRELEALHAKSSSWRRVVSRKARRAIA